VIDREAKNTTRKKPRGNAGLFSWFTYLLRPEPGPVGVSVDPLGDALGPSVFPDGFIVVFGPVVAPMLPELAVPVFLPVVLPVALPFIDEPVAAPLAAEPPAVELPPAEPPPLCASANVLDNARAVAKAILVSLMIDSFLVKVEK
jgi:hypothetical protein